MSHKSTTAAPHRGLLIGITVVLTWLLAAAAGLWVLGCWIFHGPSESARDALAETMLQSEYTAWIPGLFLDGQLLEQLGKEPPELPRETQPAAPNVTVVDGPEPEDPWANCPDGIRIETYPRRTFIAHVMLIKDPSLVYLATSSDSFNIETTGTRIPNQLRLEGAIAGINAGAFNDDGSSGTHVGSLPIGMVVSEGRILWDDGRSYEGFVGMTADNRLYVSKTINRAAVEENKIRDGCCFGPVLIENGQINEKVYSRKDTLNARTAIGQRADGTIIFLCIDGRQAGSIGGYHGDAMDLLQELGAVNACALDGGASTVMVYKDTYGCYGKAGATVTCTSYSLYQASPRRMPTFFMVRKPETEG